MTQQEFDAYIESRVAARLDAELLKRGIDMHDEEAMKQASSTTLPETTEEQEVEKEVWELPPSERCARNARDRQAARERQMEESEASRDLFEWYKEERLKEP